ncbi:YdeI/OmpD-associated family protein [Granulicoccus sp. GXG6511]|uniref:YdeI/OmpD-associated family protein n=1 Tax=Granulicoccus sp. GXG6511 TaxID=3381351 RepID=UPI003D7CCB42
MKFRAVLENRGGNTAAFTVPADVVDALQGGRRPKVVVTLGDHTWRSSIAVYGGVHYLGVSIANRKAADAIDGETYDVQLELDVAERVIETPADLATALEAAGVEAAWGLLSFSRRRKHVMAIEGAKQPETRARRIAACVAALQN